MDSIIRNLLLLSLNSTSTTSTSFVSLSIFPKVFKINLSFRRVGNDNIFLSSSVMYERIEPESKSVLPTATFV